MLLARQPQPEPTSAASDPLSRLLGPLSRETFVSDHWQRSPVHIRRDHADHFEDLGGLWALDEICGVGEPPTETVRVIRDGIDLPEVAYTSTRRVLGKGMRRMVDVDLLVGVFKRGASIVFSMLDEYLPALDTFCRLLEAELTTPVGANLYATPAGGRAFGPHWDNHDVFVMQLEGEKHWLVAEEAAYPFPITSQRFESDQLELGKPKRSYHLRAGDTLYIPRGFVHQAACTSTADSVHLSLSVFAIPWIDVFARALDDVAERDLLLRTALPLGFARDERALDEARSRVADAIDALARQLRACDVVTAEAERFVLGRRTTPRPRLAMIDAALSGDDELAVHADEVLRLRRVADEVQLVARGRRLVFAAAEVAVIEDIVARRRCRIGSLPGPAEIVLAVARRLLEAGVVGVVRREA